MSHAYDAFRAQSATSSRRRAIGTSTTTPAREVRRVVAGALRQRRFLLDTRRGGMSDSSVRIPMMRLEVWLQRTTDHASAATLRAFWRDHANDLRMVMPATRGGIRSLKHMETLCS